MEQTIIDTYIIGAPIWMKALIPFLAVGLVMLVKSGLVRDFINYGKK